MLRDLSTGSPIEHSRARLRRSRNAVSARLRTNGLPANTSVLVIWAAFNDPGECTIGNAETGAPCGPGDLANDAAGGHVSVIGTFTTSPRGSLGVRDTLAVDDLSRCADGLPCRDGLTDPLDAELHVVIIDSATGTSLQGAQFLSRPVPHGG